MILYAVKFFDGKYKTKYKREGRYGKSKSLRDAKLYATERGAVENTVSGLFTVVEVEIHEAVAPVVYTHWEKQDEGWDSYHRCSACGYELSTLDGASPESNGIHFCPHCGARMDEEVEHGSD